MSRDIRNMPLYQSDASYNRSLQELKRRVSSGVALSAYDDNTRGSKNTECTLGLCDDKIEESQDGVYGRRHHHCPHDIRYFHRDGSPTGAKPELSGCFHTCRVFKRRKKDTQQDVLRRIEAIQLIPEKLAAGDDW